MAHHRYRKRKRKTVGRFITKAMLLCFMSLAIVMGATVFFKIETITVEGNGHYSQEEIISATNIQLGENLFALKREEISKKITYVLPYVQSLEIKLNLPTGIKLVVQEQVGMVELVTEDGIWYMGVQGKLLENSTNYTPSAPMEDEEPSIDETETSQEEGAEILEAASDDTDEYALQPLATSTEEMVQQLASEVADALPWDNEQSYDLEFDPYQQPIITVTGISPLEPQAGELIQVSEEDQRQLSALLVLFQELETLDLFHNISWIHVDKLNYLEFDYMSRFRVKLPFNCDFHYKLRALLAAVADRESYETGIMDLTQEHYAVLFTPE